MASKKLTILLVEDDQKLAELIKEYLEENEYEVCVEYRGDVAIERILNEVPDMVILDLMLPYKDGLSICREIRHKYSNPIMILTARSDEVDEIVGLEVGADDYLCKPVKPRLLLARICNLLRRNEKLAENNEESSNFHNQSRHNVQTLSNGRITLDASKRLVIVNGEEVVLTTGEFDLLWFFLLHPGVILTREEIYRQLRGVEWDGLDRTIDLRVARLRKKLGDSGKFPQIIKSVRGSGYLLVDEP